MSLKKPKVKGAKKKQKDKDTKWKEQNSGGEQDDEREDEVRPSLSRNIFLTAGKLTGSTTCYDP